MSNPKDWFRRRIRDPRPLAPAASGDPFEADSVLELGHKSGLEPALGGERSPAGLATRDGLAAESPSGKGGSVPPPPPRSISQRAPRVIDSAAFIVRPEVIRLDEAKPGAPPAA